MKIVKAKFQCILIRQLHTIISRDTIKPSSPTPPHLKTRYLSLVDRFAPNIHMPFLLFYQNYNNCDTIILKKSLSQCLTQYYPFAGRFIAPSASQIDCNDDGVDFYEASLDSRLDEFIQKREQDESLDQLIPDALGCAVNKTSTEMVKVQLNHFTCGGAAIAVSISHKVADAFTMVNFMKYWATVTRGETPIKPSFISTSTSKIKMTEFIFKGADKINYETRRFVIPNSKLNDLRNKINAMDIPPMNPTRVEAMTSLLFKCAVDAATTKSESFQPSNLIQAVNMRNRIKNNSPKLLAGNIQMMVVAKMVDSQQVNLNKVIGNLRKEMMDLHQVRDIHEVGEKLANTMLMLGDDHGRSYNFTSLCRFPFYEVDFGWGKPVQVVLRTSNADGTLFILMDTPTGEGIEAHVCLDEEEMSFFEKNKDLLAYVDDN